VIFIISILSVSILLSFRSGQEQAFLTRAAAAFESELRKTQNLSIVSADFEGATPCGYGIYYIDSRVFRIYVGKQGTAPSCRASDHNYQSSIDSVFQELRIIEPEVVFKSGFPNIFFEPPDPTTYINNSSVIGVSTTIQFCLEKDLNKCRNLTVDTAGRISIQ
jgi:hypothetical protein